MDIEEVKQQTKNWLDSRLKNPYFGAVLAVWLITNRIIVFSIFNFDSNYRLQSKLDFIHTELQKFDRLDFLWGLKGFWATIIWSFFWGYFVMLVADQLNGLGKVLFKLGNRTTNFLLKKVEPLKWIEVKLYNDLKKEKEDFEEDINNRKIEIKRLQKENDDTLALLNQTIKEKDDKTRQVETNLQTLQLLEEQIRQHAEEKNKFNVTYAKYGTEDISIEVTKVVKDLLSTQNKFQASNKTLKYDPHRYSIKKLVIDYQFNSEAKSIIVNEEEIVELENGVLRSSETKESNNLKKWSQYLEDLSNIMNGQWRMTISKGGKKQSGTITIDKTGKFIVDGVHKYDLLVTSYDGKQIVFNKILLDGRTLNSTETLNIINGNLLSGNDKEGHTVDYTKIG